MKEKFYSVLFLIIEAGALLFFLSHHALTPGFTILLLVLIAKNIFVLYSSSMKDKPQENSNQPGHASAAGSAAAADTPVLSGTAFSERSLARIDHELSEATLGNRLFGYSASSEELSARFGYGEGLDVYSDGTRYICEYLRERSFDMEYEYSEQAAVNRFINDCKLGMAVFRDGLSER